jgi:RNA polymerase sigma-70 factor (ECF subfamily)
MDDSRRLSLFNEAVSEHMGILLKAAHGFSDSATDREDLVQEMLIAVWQALPGYNGRCKLSTFLYRVVHNRALNWQRSRHRYGRKLDQFAELPHLTVDTNESQATQRKLEWLYAVIRQLPLMDRTLLMLQLDGVSQREIAEVTGLTESNVGVRLHRIKQGLTKQRTDFANEH